MQKRSLIGLCKEFLGLPNEDLKTFAEQYDLKAFAAQYKRLTEKDKEDLIAEFAKMGFEATISTK